MAQGTARYLRLRDAGIANAHPQPPGLSFTATARSRSISCAQLFTALDKLHPRIAEIGMHRFAQTASHSTLDLDHEDMIAFERRWVEGLTAFQLIQAELAPSEQVSRGPGSPRDCDCA